MSFKIHPGIGLARIGDSEEWFIAEETAAEPQPPFSYRDSECRIKRQGARFRIWEYDSSGPVRERTADNATITWTVRLAAIRLTPAPKVKLVGRNQLVVLSESPFVELRTDDDGRLIVLSDVISQGLGL